MYLALVFSMSARFCAHGARVSPFTTINTVNSDNAMATDKAIRRRDTPTARSAVNSEVAANCPRPINAPITAAIGNKV
ncbi:hypothetical protein D3C81_1552380 [compost metagenome]